MTTVINDSYAGGGTPVGELGLSTGGICTLSFAGNVFKFRTNPNSIWWSYELLKNVDYTYGGQVIQILGVKLGDLQVKVDCGKGGWPYLVQVATFLRELMAYQRGGNVATFEYTNRGWSLNVYAMSIPFEDQLTATTREITLNFKVQEDITGVVSGLTIDTEILRLQSGTMYNLPHNQWDDARGVMGNLDAMMGATPMDDLLAATNMTAQTPSGPTYTSSGISNTVDNDPEGNVSDIADLIPGAGDLLNQLGGSDIAVPGIGPVGL